MAINKGLRACGWLIASAASSGACAADFELATPHTDVPIALDSSADVPFTITNNTDSASPALTINALTPLATQYAYALQDSPGCGPLTYQVEAVEVARNTLAIASVPAHGQRTCTLRVARSSSAFDNAEELWTVTAPSYVQPVILRLGTFVDMRLTSERISQQVSAAGVHSIFKLRIHNASAISVEPRASIQYCFSSLTFDSDLPGACPVEAGYCGVSEFSPAAIVFPRVAAGAVGDCLVGTTTGLWDNVDQMAYVGSLLDSATGGVIMDSNNADGNAFLSTSLPPVSLNQYGLSGSWANPDMSSQGVVMSVQPDFYGAGHALLFGGWFTYDVFGSGDVRWYTLQGQVDGTSANVPIYLTRSGRLDSAQPTLTTPAGSATIRFADCTHGELVYSIAETPSTLPRTGAVPLTRLLSNVGCTPSGAASVPPAAYAMSGVWADTGTQGQGLVIDIDTHQNVLFAAWYTYTAQADIAGVDGQHWYTLQASIASSATEAGDVGLYESSGGRFNAARPATTVPVGNAHFTLHSCSSATLAYQFTAGANAGSSGSLELTRLGAAPPGCAR